MTIDKFIFAIIISITFMFGWICSKKRVVFQMKQEVKIGIKTSIHEFNTLADTYDSLYVLPLTDPELLKSTYIETIRAHERLKVWVSLNNNLNEH